MEDDNEEELKQSLAEYAADAGAGSTGYCPIGVYSKWGQFTRIEDAYAAFEELRDAAAGVEDKVHTVSTQYIATWVGFPKPSDPRVSWWYTTRNPELRISIDFPDRGANHTQYIVTADRIHQIVSSATGVQERIWARYATAGGMRSTWAVVWSTFPRAPTYAHRDYIPYDGSHLVREIEAMVTTSMETGYRQHLAQAFIDSLAVWNIVPSLSNENIEYVWSNLARLYGELRKFTVSAVTRDDIEWVLGILDGLTRPGCVPLSSIFEEQRGKYHNPQAEWDALPRTPR